jgi:hypothetical protein
MLLRITITSLLLIFFNVKNHAAVEYKYPKAVKSDTLPEIPSIKRRKLYKAFTITAAITAFAPLYAPINLVLCLILLKWAKRYGFTEKLKFLRTLLAIAICATIILIVIAYEEYWGHNR